jgi:hypothetical protein
MKVGVEAEYWVVDETGALCDGRELLDAHEHVEPEFISSLIEIKTPPVETESSSVSVAEARRIRLDYADRLERDVETLLMSPETCQQSKPTVPTDGVQAATDHSRPCGDCGETETGLS